MSKLSTEKAVDEFPRVWDCKWSEPFCQRDMTTAYHCRHQSALDEIANSNGEFVSCYCLGLVEGCPHFEHVKN